MTARFFRVAKRLLKMRPLFHEDQLEWADILEALEEVEVFQNSKPYPLRAYLSRVSAAVCSQPFGMAVPPPVIERAVLEPRRSCSEMP